MATTAIAALLDKLEGLHGVQLPHWPIDPYEFIVWWLCGYPASDERCEKGWAALTSEVGITPEKLLGTPPAILAAALRSGGMVPELRALRLKQIAMLIRDAFGGDLRSALIVDLKEARRSLKRFPSIADSGADRILLFAGISPIAAVPSNCPHVLVRILFGKERENYAVNYKQAQSTIAAQVPGQFSARQRAFLLLKKHGQEICKTKNPRCDICPLTRNCAYFAGHYRGRAASQKVPGSRR